MRALRKTGIFRDVLLKKFNIESKTNYTTASVTTKLNFFFSRCELGNIRKGVIVNTFLIDLIVVIAFIGFDAVDGDVAER